MPRTVHARQRVRVSAPVEVAPLLLAATQPARVDGIVSCLVQERGEPARQLRVDKEFHAADSGTTRRPAARAPNTSAAKMSSRSRSG